MKTLISLEDHNKRMHELYNPPKSKGNGIACPKCGFELYDSSPNMTLTSDPPQMNVACTNCEWRGTRVC